MKVYDPEPGTAESKIEARAAKVIADKIYEHRYGDSTEFAGERMDECDVLSIDIIDLLEENGLAIVYMPDLDKHRSGS